MPRKARRRSATDIYHVMLRGNNKEMIFQDPREKQKMKELLLKMRDEPEAELYAYCIMSNHLHLLLKIPLEQLSVCIQKTATSYAVFYNISKDRVGHVFQNRFRTECIENERYFWTCLRYIHQNPVKAGLVPEAEYYPYSSMKEYLSEEHELLSEKALAFAGKHFSNGEDFLAFHREKNQMIFLDTGEEQRHCREEIIFDLLDIEKQLIPERFNKESVIEKKYYQILLKRICMEIPVSAREADEIMKSWMQKNTSQ